MHVGIPPLPGEFAAPLPGRDSPLPFHSTHLPDAPLQDVPSLHAITVEDPPRPQPAATQRVPSESDDDAGRIRLFTFAGTVLWGVLGLASGWYPALGLSGGCLLAGGIHEWWQRRA